MSNVIVGIDLGTTNSVAALADEAGEVTVLTDERGYKVQPSVVSFHPNGSVVVGAEAKQRRVIDPSNTVYSAKRLIGRSFRSREVAAAIERMPYAIKEGVNEQPVIVTRGGEFAVPEISAIVLDHMRTIASRASGGTADRAVITVPASFTDAQRSATATAGAIAGLTVVRVLNEPTAAALAYGHRRRLDQVIGVYDFGGGTFDITILRLADNVFEVLGTAGDSFLGGDDLDERLVDQMVDQFLRDQRVDLRDDPLALQRLRQVAEQVKIQLSRRSRAVIKIDEIAYGPGGVPLDLAMEVSREQFVAQVADIVERTFPVCAEALKLAGLGADRVADVVLVGGTTRMPHVRERVAAFFGRAPHTDVNPEEAVAVGAALQAVSLARILGGSARPTAQAAVAPPAPPMAARAPAPHPEVPPSRVTAPRLASEATVVDDTFDDATEETTGLRERHVGGAFGVAPPGRRTQPMGGAAEPSPTERRARPGSHSDVIPMLIEDEEAETRQPLARIRPSAAPSRARAAPPRTPAAPPPVPPAPPQARTLLGAAAPLPAQVRRAPVTFSDPATDVPTEVRPPGPPRPGKIPVGPVPVSTPSAPTAISLDPPPVDLGPAATGGPMILDVTPHSLGIATVAGYAEAIIGRNARVPTEKKRLFATSKDRQQVVRIQVCQGESRRLNENIVLGDLVLDGLEARPRGETRIEVTFHIDASGILQVRARDTATGAEQRASLDLKGAQSPEEVSRAAERLRELRS